MKSQLVASCERESNKCENEEINDLNTNAFRLCYIRLFTELKSADDAKIISNW